MELHALLQPERPGQPVLGRLPGLRQRRHELPALVHLDEEVEDVQEEAVVHQVEVVVGVHLLDLFGPAFDQLVPALRGRPAGRRMGDRAQAG